MSCRHCGSKLKKNDEFVLVGAYPGKWRKMGYHYLFDGPECFGELYHEACTTESAKKKETMFNRKPKP